MAQRILTFQSLSSKFRQDVILDNVSVTIVLEWNSRAGYWFVTISDGVYTLSKKKLVANWPLLRQSIASFPSLKGSIIALQDDANAANEITYDNLNDGWGFYYITEEELNSWEINNGL